MAYTHTQSLSHMVPHPSCCVPKAGTSWRLAAAATSTSSHVGQWLGRTEPGSRAGVWYTMVPCMYHVKGPLTSSIPFRTSLDFLRNRMQDCIQLNDQSDIFFSWEETTALESWHLVQYCLRGRADSLKRGTCLFNVFFWKRTIL